MPFRNYHFRNFDIFLVLLVAALSFIGYVAIGSAEPDLQSRQLFGYASGAVLMIVLVFLDYHFVLKFYWLIYLFNLVLLTLVLLMGESSHNAQRWLKIGGLQFQPSELAKILLILFFAAFIMRFKERFNTIPVICACIALFAVPFALVFEQPDLSTSIMLMILFFVIMYSGKISYKVVLGFLIIAIPVVLIASSYILNPNNEILESYQMNRLLGFLYPEEYPDIAYQQNNSVTAIASGMLEGKGYRNNEITSVKNGNFLSEAQTDFIFAVIGEEFGFYGAALTIILLFLVSLRCISIARRAPDLSGSIIAAAVGSMIAFQSFINIGVATFLLPNTGLPLPFVSYGLTSVWTLYIGIGLVLNIKLQVKRGNSSAVDELN
ncbi:MAG: rod shape-determining protein RodA [Lachnospiraceae bacterium]|nr:rod shape-determining protein RodA [Lachnospiraceae bacterium]